MLDQDGLDRSDLIMSKELATITHYQNLALDRRSPAA